MPNLNTPVNVPQQKMSTDLELASRDFDGWLRTLDAPQREAVTGAFQMSTPATIEADRRRFLSVAQVASDTGVDAMEVSQNFESFYLPLYAEKVLGNKGAGGSVDLFHRELLNRKIKHRQERELLFGAEKADTEEALKASRKSSLAQIVTDSVFAGRPYADALADWEATARSKEGYDVGRHDEYARMARNLDADLRATREEIKPLAVQAMLKMSTAVTRDDYETMLPMVQGFSEKQRGVFLRELQHLGETQFTAFGRSLSKSMVNVPEFVQMLTKSSKAVIRSVHDLFLSHASQSESDIIDQVRPQLTWAASPMVPELIIARGPEAIGEHLKVTARTALQVDPSTGFSAAPPSNFNEGLKRALTDPERAEVLGIMEKRLDTINELDELRELGTELSDPIKGNNWFTEKFYYPALRSSGVTMAALLPSGAGLALTTGYYRRKAYLRLRREGLDHETASRDGFWEGVGQAGVEQLGGAIARGLFPRLGALFNAPVGGQGQVWGRFALRAGGSIGWETMEELVQEHLIPALVADVSQAGGDIEWFSPQGPWAQMAKASPDTIMAVTLLSLMCSGAATAADVTNSQMLLANADLLKGYELSDRQAHEVAGLSRAGDVEGALTKFREYARQARTAGQSMGGAAQVAAGKAQQTQERRASAMAALESAGVVPVVSPAGDGRFRLQMADGREVHFASEAEAQMARAQALSTVVQRLHERAREGVQQVATGAATRKQAHAGGHSESTAVEARPATDQATSAVSEAAPSTEGAEQAFAMALALGDVSVPGVDFRDAVHAVVGETYAGHRAAASALAASLGPETTAEGVAREAGRSAADRVLAQKNGREVLISALRDAEKALGRDLLGTPQDASVDDKTLAEAFGSLAGVFFAGQSRQPASPEAGRAEAASPALPGATTADADAAAAVAEGGTGTERSGSAPHSGMEAGMTIAEMQAVYRGLAGPLFDGLAANLAAVALSEHGFAESADSAAQSDVAATPAGTQVQPAARPPAAQEMMGAFPLDPVDNSNLENENEHHGSTRPSEEGARSGRSGQPRLRPQDWQRERPGVDARGAGEAASRSFREVYAGLPAEVSSPVAEAWRQRIAPAEIAAVAAGRKPAFHEYLGDEAAPLAQALGREFPGLHVEAFDGHLVVADLDLVGTIAGTADPAAASAALREAALSDNIGEYLGYGVPHWNEADAIVTLRDASGEMLAGFHTLNEGVEDFARDRAQDYAAYLGPGVTAEIELKRKPQPRPQSQPQGQSGDQGQSQDQVPSASQGLSGAPSQAGDPQGAAPAPAGTGNTGLAAPASRERAAQYFEQAFEASSALFQHLGLGIEEIHTEAEAAARGIPAHISVGVSRDGRRLVVVRPRLEPGTTAALAAAITREELIHAAWIAALREQWRRDPHGRTFQDHLRHEEGRILEELELTEAGREALLNTVNIYHGQGRTQTGPLYTSYDQARAAVDGGLSGMVTELARQLIQMREGGRLSEHVFARTMRRLRDWMRKALRGLKKLAARPENASPLLNQAIRDTEAILEGRDISPSPWDAEATEYYGAPSWGDGPPPAMLRLEVPETAPDMAGLFIPTGEGVRGFQGQVAQAAVPALPVVLTGVQPTVLSAAGAPGGAPLAVLPKVFADMDRLKLNPEEKQALLDHLLRPIAVFGPRTPPYSVRVLTPYLEEGRPVLAEVLLHRTRSGAVEHQVSGLVAVGEEEVHDFYRKELLYESKLRSARWEHHLGRKLPPQRGMLYSSAQSYILSPEKVTEWRQNQKSPLPPELKAGAVFDKVKRFLPRAKDSLPVLDANLAAPALIDQAEQFLRDHPVVDAPGTGRILLAHPEKGSLRTRAEHLVASHAVTDRYKSGPRISKPEKSLSLPAMVQTVADYHLILEHKGARIYVRCYVNGDIHAVFTSADAKNTPHGPVQETLSSQRILKDGLDGARIIKVRE